MHVSDPADGDGPSTVGPMGPVGSLMPMSRGGMAGIRRGPGRPRLRPSGPGHQGYRTPSHHHGKKIQRPLQVPIRSHQTITSVDQQKASSSQQRHSATGSSPMSSSSVAAANSLLTSSSSSSSSTESRPFGYYTQQQPRTGSS